MMKLGLRLRILLFFALIFAVGLAGFVLALWLAHTKAGAAPPVAPLIQAALIGGVVLLGVVTVVWLLFDENVARPLLALSSELRSCAHAGVDRAIDLEPARYLGDLAPAAEATSARVRESRREAERAVREASERIAQERNRFATLLRDAPVALILCTRSHRIALYNAEAVARFGCPDGALGLHRPVFDLFPGPALREAIAGIEAGQEEVETLHETGNGERCSLRVSAIHADGDDVSDGYLIACGPRSGGTAPGPRERCIDFYDFGLIRPGPDLALPARCLREIDYVVFDTETTGLEPQRGDEIVQIAGMRIVNGRLLRGEAFDMLVDPGRPIPAGSTEIHGITGEMVADAPDIATAAARFHRYSRESVLVAHNAPFDLAFLQKNEARTGCRFDQPVLDTVLLSAIVFGAGAEHSLDALAERLDVSIPAHLRHTALGDSAATAEAFLKLLPLLHARGIDTLADALAAEDAIRGAVGMPKLDREPLPA